MHHFLISTGGKSSKHYIQGAIRIIRCRENVRSVHNGSTIILGSARLNVRPHFISVNDSLNKSFELILLMTLFHWLSSLKRTALPMTSHEYVAECDTVVSLHIWKTQNAFTKLSEQVIYLTLVNDTYGRPVLLLVSQFTLYCYQLTKKISKQVSQSSTKENQRL